MKILDRGYWVSKHFYWQSMMHYLTDVIRFRSFTYFTACNRAIALGGMLDDAKTEAYDILPSSIVPFTRIVKNANEVKSCMQYENITFPIIIKPNVGLKGFLVTKVENENQLNAFFKQLPEEENREWLLQEYLDQSREFSALFYKVPQTGEYGVTSFIEKQYPCVVGNGESTLEELIESYKNPFLKRDEVWKKLEKQRYRILDKGEKLILDYIGNYSRGAKFFSLNNEIDDQLKEMLFDKLKHISDLNFFRLDLKSNSIEAFKTGDFKILEVNGLKSEPLHIYDPKSSFIDNIKEIRNHWRVIGRIAKSQYEEDSQTPSLKEGLKSLASIKRLVK